MIMSKADFEDDWDTATKNMEEYKRDKQKWDNEKNKELRDLKTYASLLQNIQDNTDILCKLGAVIVVLLIIIAFQLFYQLLQLERYKGNDMSLEDIFNWIWTVNILWIILPIIALVILIINLDTIVDNWGLIAFWIGLLAFLWIYS